MNGNGNRAWLPSGAPCVAARNPGRQPRMRFLAYAITTGLLAVLLGRIVQQTCHGGFVHTMNDATKRELLQLSQEESESLQRSRLVLDAAKKVNEAAGSNAAIEDLFPNAVPMKPLEFAAQSGDLAEAKVALKDGADVNALATAWSQITGVEDYRVLHVAAEQGHLPIIELLLNLGADPFVQTADGRTPLDLAQANGHTQVAKLLKAKTK